MIETFQPITLAVCCGYVSNLIGRRTINIPEIILDVHGLMGFTVKVSHEIEGGLQNNGFTKAMKRSKHHGVFHEYFMVFKP